MKLSLALKYAREAAGLTQDQLAHACGIHSRQISHYETGHSTPSLKSLQKIGDALGIKLRFGEDTVKL
jgi:transcriptional regulator with XRE-family HTH domain